MRTIEKSVSTEIIIKNSRFICYLFPLDQNNVSTLLEQVKEEHAKATHYCYAYIYDDIIRSSDDGEPGGTAGMPILNVLQKEELNHVLTIVVRYFGGIKLGAGGLVRAYTKSVTETLKEASTIELVEGYKIKIHFPYEDEKNVLYLLNQSVICSKEYLNDITYVCYIDSFLLNKLDRYNPVILEKCFIKKLNSN